MNVEAKRRGLCRRLSPRGSGTLDFPFATLGEDIAEGRPAGSDLELDGDADFMRFMAQIEGVLPQSFASFDRGAVDLPAHIAEVGALLTRSKDLRLIAAAAKLFILNRDLESFSRSLGVIADWLLNRWDSIFPELMDGDAIMRLIALQSLDDIPHTVKPLEAAPLFRSRRAGSVSLRLSLLSEGKIAPRQGDDGENEKVPTAGDIASAIHEAAIDEIIAAREQTTRLAEAIDAIEAAWVDKTGREGELRFSELKPKTHEVLELLERAAVSRDPSLASKASAAEVDDALTGAGGDAPAAPPGAIATLAQAKAAMSAAERYFRAHEPSSPVRLLLAQAEALMGKSFFESLQQLMPDVAPLATVPLGRDLPLKLPLERLVQLLPEASGSEGGDAGTWEETPEQPEGEAEAPAEAPSGAAENAFTAGTRAEAVSLLESAAAYFRAAEPSSAIPLLIEIARGSVGRDFMSLVKDALPAHALRVDE